MVALKDSAADQMTATSAETMARAAGVFAAQKPISCWMMNKNDVPTPYTLHIESGSIQVVCSMNGKVKKIISLSGVHGRFETKQTLQGGSDKGPSAEEEEASMAAK